MANEQSESECKCNHQKSDGGIDFGLGLFLSLLGASLLANVLLFLVYGFSVLDEKFHLIELYKMWLNNK
ncbi:hypothetical protein R4576_18165 [Acinetobacter baumannii]|nr:hypothetical protein [Acinetobacter baumannii]